MEQREIINRTRHWISSVVIGLNLCPFAQRVFDAEQIRYVVTDSKDREALRQALSSELTTLVQIPGTSIETTLLIHPLVLGNFLEYVDFLTEADQCIVEHDLRGIIQIASFHPEYYFADADPESVENYTNRSPYPMLHLLREDSISKVASEPESLLAIPIRNKQTLNAMGKDKIVEILREIQD